MKRFKHSLSHYKLLTCDFGQLVPIGLLEVLPGDTIQHSTSLLVRLSPLLAPVMHPVSIRVHHWFCPNRLVYEGWEDFITGGPDGTGSSIPYPTTGADLPVTQGMVWDYLGVPPHGTAYPAGRLNTMPRSAYNLIYNEFYRDQDLQAPVLDNQNQILRVAWEKDYFTSARPWSQKGPAVTLPIGTSAPVIGDPATDQYPTFSPGTLGTPNQNMRWPNAAPANVNFANASTTGQEPVKWSNPKLIADLSAAVSPDIIAFRQAMALQRYQEARA